MHVHGTPRTPGARHPVPTGDDDLQPTGRRDIYGARQTERRAQLGFRGESSPVCARSTYPSGLVPLPARAMSRRLVLCCLIFARPVDPRSPDPRDGETSRRMPSDDIFFKNILPPSRRAVQSDLRHRRRRGVHVPAGRPVSVGVAGRRGRGRVSENLQVPRTDADCVLSELSRRRKGGRKRVEKQYNTINITSVRRDVVHWTDTFVLHRVRRVLFADDERRRDNRFGRLPRAPGRGKTGKRSAFGRRRNRSRGQRIPSHGEYPFVLARDSFRSRN